MNKKFLPLILFAVALFFVMPLLLPFVIIGMTADGFKAEGVIHSGKMAVSITITKGYAVYIDSDGYIALAPANTILCIGVSLETKTSAAGEHPVISYVAHGICDAHILSTGTDLAAGDPIMVSATDGMFCKETDTGITTGGKKNAAKVGKALEAKDVSVDQDCEIWFCP